MEVVRLLRAFKGEFQDQFRGADYLLADTRVKWVSLYDHLVLTAGIATAMVVELLERGMDPQRLCGQPLSPEELRALACLCGLAHDMGKARLGETEYRHHVSRGVEYVESWLATHNVDDPYRSLIRNAVARHHLRDNPETPLEKIVCLADSYASAGDRPELGRAADPRQFERLTAQTRELESELFGSELPLRLLLGDVNSIKGYVRETSALPEIRGASQILLEMEDKVREDFASLLAEESLIYCGGGGLLAVVPSSQAAKWEERIRHLYLRDTKLVTITLVTSEPLGYADFARGLKPYDDQQVRGLQGEGIAADLLFSHYEAVVSDRTKRKNFGELVARLGDRLRQKKQALEAAPFLEALPVSRRCDSCGKRSAQRWDSTREEWICSPCWQKRSKGREERRTFLEEFKDWVKENHDVSISGGAKDLLPTDLDSLSHEGEKGRIAFLYADGNNMGDLFQLAPSPASYRHFSQTLETAVKETLFSAIWRTFGAFGLLSQRPLPFEIIAAGGDDLAVIVPASRGWLLALEVLESFERPDGPIRRLEREINERLQGSLNRPVALNLSVGLAIADVKYPVAFLFDLAEGLLQEAKRLARSERTGTLCHLWLRAPVLSEDAGALLENLYHDERKNYRLTARPYTWKQGKELTNAARVLKELPASQRRGLAEALERGVDVSLNYTFYQLARWKEEERKKYIDVFKELARIVGGDPQNRGFWFWMPHKGEWATALLDALELVELGAL
ncbi:MAG: hypothetical protein KatS3mg115_2454 [Candidatus Poribacteria bacterium]|nr:MAG: hypothetical protein KatS3mg115_2454 [Candidatus Poribacteria bacterium]